MAWAVPGRLFVHVVAAGRAAGLTTTRPQSVNDTRGHPGAQNGSVPVVATRLAVWEMECGWNETAAVCVGTNANASPLVL